MPESVKISRVEDRISRNLALAEPVFRLSRDRREAVRRVFSIFHHLEKIAVIAAERGDGVEGQLEDEIVHMESFGEVAKQLGWIQPAPPSVERLIAYIQSQTGALSMLCLNIVGESWLEGIFHECMTWGIADELLQGIEAEEDRHVREARIPGEIDKELASAHIRQLEKHLYAVTTDPEFVFPLAYLGGISRVASLGRSNVRNHRAAIEKLGIEAGTAIEAIARCGVDATEDTPTVTRFELDPWRQSAVNMGIGSISNLVDVRWHHLDEQLELRVVSALLAVLTENPQWNLTIHNTLGEIYQVSEPRVAVRRLYNREGWVSSIYIRPDTDLQRLEQQMKRRTARMRALPYQAVPKMDEALKRLAPAPRVVAAVTNTASFGMHRGTPALVPDEGCSISINIGAPKDGYIALGVVVDHRVLDGRELGQLSEALRKHLER